MKESEMERYSEFMFAVKFALPVIEQNTRNLT